MSETRESYTTEVENSKSVLRRTNEEKGGYHLILPVVFTRDEGVLTPNEFKVFLNIWGHADRYERKAWPGQHRMAQELGLSQAVVSRAITRLAELGAITIEPLPGYAGRRNCYIFNDEWRPNAGTNTHYPPEDNENPPEDNGSKNPPEDNHNPGEDVCTYRSITRKERPASRARIRVREEAGMSGDAAAPSPMMASAEREDLSGTPPSPLPPAPLPPAPQVRGKQKKREPVQLGGDPMKGVAVTPEMQEVFGMVSIENDPHQQSRVAKVFKACPDVDIVFEVAPMFEWHKARKGIKDFPRALMNWCSNTQRDINARKSAGTYRPALRSVGSNSIEQSRYDLPSPTYLTQEERDETRAILENMEQHTREKREVQDRLSDMEIDELLAGIL